MLGGWKELNLQNYDLKKKIMMMMMMLGKEEK